MGRSVTDLLRQWDALVKRAPVQRPIGVKAGDDAKLECFPRAMSREYVPLKVVGVGSAGVDVSANFVKQGHTMYQVAISRLDVYFGGGSIGFPETASRRFEQEANLRRRVSNTTLSSCSHMASLRPMTSSGSSDMRFQEEHVVGLALQLLTVLDELHRSHGYSP